MYCLSNMCYVCLDKKDKSLITINSSLSVNKDMMHIIGYLPCSLGWLKTKRIILICKECCRRLRETYQFLIMCDKTSAVMQGYVAQLNPAFTSTADNAAELRADMNIEHDDINEIKYEIKSEDGEIFIFESGPMIEETEEVFANVDDSCLKEEAVWKRAEVDDEEEPPMENNSTESSDVEPDTEMSVNRNNTHATGTDSASSGSTSTQGRTTNKKKRNTPAKKSHKCLICSKFFRKKSSLQRHTRVHTGEKPYKCATCKRCFARRSSLVRHMRIHSGEKPFKCTECKRCFSDRSNLVSHMRTHTGERPYECSVCKRSFRQRSNLVTHMRIHAGQKQFQCASCKLCFRSTSKLFAHMRRHTGE